MILGVKSILSGEYKESPSKKWRQKKQYPSFDETSGHAASSPSHRNTSTASGTNNTLEEKEEAEDTAEVSSGSTELGDSFVISIDWPLTSSSSNNTRYYENTTNGLNDSLEDPYLPPSETMRQRLRKQEEKKEQITVPDAHNNSSTPPTRGRAEESSIPANNSTLMIREVSPIRSVRHMIGGSSPPTSIKKQISFDVDNDELCPPPITANSNSKSMGSFEMPVKSLGAFSLPLIDPEDEDEPDAAVIAVPRRAHFDPSLDNSNKNEEDEDEEEDESKESSFALPTSPPVLHISSSSSKPVTPSRKRRILARQSASDLRNALERQRGSSSKKNLRTANLYLQLALAEQRSFQPSAIVSFFQAAAIYRRFGRPVAIATALDGAAVTYCQALERGLEDRIHEQHEPSRFYRCLREALTLRKRELGPWHVDTVDTLQHLAQFYLLTEDPEKAAAHYQEVVYLRSAIFGPHHPSAAVAAHCLGNAYLQSHNTCKAEVWYGHALKIYNHMHLPSDNPTVAKLLRDRKRLERVERWIQEDPADDEALLFDL